MFSMELINECKARKDAVSEKKPLSDPFTLSQLRIFTEFQMSGVPMQLRATPLQKMRLQ